MNTKEFVKTLETLKYCGEKTSGRFSYRRTLKVLQRFKKLKPILDYQDQLINITKDRRVKDVDN